MYALTPMAGELGDTHDVSLGIERHTAMAEPYLEAAAAITVVLLVGAGWRRAPVAAPARPSGRCSPSAPARPGCCATRVR